MWRKGEHLGQITQESERCGNRCWSGSKLNLVPEAEKFIEEGKYEVGKTNYATKENPLTFRDSWTMSWFFPSEQF